MRLFFATSSLNVDNILSTENIAPLSFYKSRNYGYNSFYGLEQIPFKKILLLFSKIPYFEINDKEQDTRPVILEINVNEKVNPLVLVGEYEGVTVYSTDTIIRLSPFNTKLLFFNEQDFNHTRTSCSDSLTNKFGDRFRFELCRADFDLAHLSNINLPINDSCNNYDQKILQDNRLNAIKGFVFGYYIGVSKSMTIDNAILLKIQKRIYDIIATIKNDGSNGNTAFFTELEELDKKYRMYDPSTRKCRELWESALKELNIPVMGLNKLLEVYDERNVLKTAFMRKNDLEPSVSLSNYGFNNVELYRDALKQHTYSIIKKDQQKNLSDFDVKKTFDLDPSFETCMLAGEDTDSMVFNKFIDSILWHGSTPTPDTLRTNRFDIATQYTISVKGIWESFNWQWKDSSAQLFMNDLRQNIKSFTPLNFNKQENVVLKSIAAFILKGEDYEAIVQLCEDHSFSDYRYALALWGATQGYVKMSKPIIANISKSSSFCKIYKDILELLYSVKQEGELPYSQDYVKIIKSKQDKSIIPGSTLRTNSVKEWQNGIHSYLEQLKNVPNKKNLYGPLESAFNEYGDQMDYAKFFALLNDYKEWKTAKGEPITAWKRMVEHFCPNEYARRFGDKPTSTQGIEKKSKSFGEKFLGFFGFSDEDTLEQSQSASTFSPVDDKSQVYSIIYDIDALKYIERFPGLGIYKKDVVAIFNEFQKSYQSGFYYKNQHQYKRNNNDVIDHFCKWCFYQKNKNAIPQSPENKKMIEELKNYLLMKYHD